MLSYLELRGCWPGPLFLFQSQKPLTRPHFVVVVREALGKSSLDERKYCSLSFRIGAATTAASRGMEDCIIKTLGRWESMAYLQYVRIPRERLASISGVLATTNLPAPPFASRNKHHRLKPGLCGESGGGPAAPLPSASLRRPEGNAAVWGEELGGRASNPAQSRPSKASLSPRTRSYMYIALNKCNAPDGSRVHIMVSIRK